LPISTSLSRAWDHDRTADDWPTVEMDSPRTSSTISGKFYGTEATKTASESEPKSLILCRFLPRKELKTVDIYVYMQGQRRGPYDKAQLQEMWNRGQLPKDTLYWHDGMSKWAVISDLFANARMPPPLPIDTGDAESMTFPPAS